MPADEETLAVLQEHDEDDDEWGDANDDDDEDDAMSGSDSLPGLLSQLAGDGKCPQMNFINRINRTTSSIIYIDFRSFCLRCYF